MEFTPARKEDESFAGRRIELQVRTRLQHSWATAIEAVSLYRNQDLKHHKGDGDWLRLFELASAEFAHVERSPLPAGVPDRAERLKELKDLNARLGAVSMLENTKAATNFAENFTHDRGRYYLLRYRPDHTVKIETYTAPSPQREPLNWPKGRSKPGKARRKESSLRWTRSRSWSPLTRTISATSAARRSLQVHFRLVRKAVDRFAENDYKKETLHSLSEVDQRIAMKGEAVNEFEH
ncbi:hypothetical protein AU467_19605 [Mesorhizobium loti]|uniref:RelA/SpoT domain-containing protein n=1 Tax=Rhizobium loti TaxID=381 RepID=A0A124GGH1_RHILI|nr:hypothetical protein AU467_19605 [Mesorhizobium loti]